VAKLGNLECVYCGEESTFHPVIPKPKFFIFENAIHQLITVKEEGELICLDCLDYEISELKDVF
jgi:hypothetical protein